METGNQTTSEVTDSDNLESCDNNKLYSSDTVTCPDIDMVTHTDTVDQMTASLDALVVSGVDVSTPVSTSVTTEVAPGVGETVEETAEEPGADDQEPVGKLPTFQEIKQQWRKFSVDLVPKVSTCCVTCSVEC